MEKIIERINLISKNENVKITSMEKEIGASKGVLSRALNNKTDIQSKWITKIAENYPNYNSEWLLTGKGEMIKKDEIQNIKTNESDYVAMLRKMTVLQDEKIEELEKKIKRLKKDLKPPHGYRTVAEKDS